MQAAEQFDADEMAAISQSGLEQAVKESERVYEAISLDLEQAAIAFYLAAVESRLT